MTERILQLTSLQTSDEFIQEFRLYSQDNSAQVIELIHGGIVVSVDENTHFYIEPSDFENTDTDITRKVVY